MVLPFGMYVAYQTAALAHEVLVGRVDIRIVPPRAAADRDFPDLAERDELAESLVSGGAAYLRQTGGGAFVDLVGREVNVLARQHFGDDAPLRGQLPAALAQALQQIFCASRPRSEGRAALD
jgi:hypothetical protein